MNRTVKVYRSVKGPSGDWAPSPSRNLEDLPEGDGKYYLAYNKGKHRQMPLVGRSADATKQKLIQKGKELDARATSVELPPETEPEPTKESNFAARVGNDGYGRTKKSGSAYRKHLGFSLGFCADTVNKN